MTGLLEFVPFNPFNSWNQNYQNSIPQSFDSTNQEESQSQVFEFNLTESLQDPIFNEVQCLQTSQSESTETKKFKSAMHNMQKHLVTLLQALIPGKVSIIASIDLNIDVYRCVKEALQIIKTLRRKTKEELVPIFGAFDQNQILRSKSSYNCLSKYPIQTIRTSFDIIKNYYVSSLKFEGTIQKYLSTSKMNKKEQFIQYLERFIEEVESNRFKFRLTKQSQTKIKNYINGKQWESYLFSTK